MANWVSFQDLRHRVSLEDILRHYGLMEKFRRSKDELIGLCPFHEETTGSFHASITKNVFHCFGCRGEEKKIPQGDFRSSVILRIGLLDR